MDLQYTHSKPDKKLPVFSMILDFNDKASPDVLFGNQPFCEDNEMIDIVNDRCVNQQCDKYDNNDTCYEFSITPPKINFSQMDGATVDLNFELNETNQPLEQMKQFLMLVLQKKNNIPS